MHHPTVRIAHALLHLCGFFLIVSIRTLNSREESKSIIVIVFLIVSTRTGNAREEKNRYSQTSIEETEMIF